MQNPNKNSKVNPYLRSDFEIQMGNIAEIVLQTTEGLALLGMSLGGSTASSTVMRFTQILKVYNRLKYIGVNFGYSLDQVLESIGKIFNDSEEDLDKIDHIRIQEGGHRGKVSHYRVFMSMTGTLGWKVFAYLISFTIQIILYFTSMKIRRNYIDSLRDPKRLLPQTRRD